MGVGFFVAHQPPRPGDFIQLSAEQIQALLEVWKIRDFKTYLTVPYHPGVEEANIEASVWVNFSEFTIIYLTFFIHQKRYQS